MTAATQPAPNITAPATNPKQQFIDVFTRENATTRRVLTSVADGYGDFRPNELCKTAGELAHVFSVEQGKIAEALNDTWSWPPAFGKAPATFEEVIAEFDATTEAVKSALATVSDSRLSETVMFFTAPKTMGPVPVGQLIWFMLLDQIHHRGQLTVYLRMAGGKVPSIYGPSKDEPWM